MSFGTSASDFVTLPTFAWDVYKACRDSSKEFRELSTEVAALHATLSEFNALVSRYRLSDESQIRLGTILESCFGVIPDVEKQLQRYKSLGSSKKRKHDRVK